MQELRGALVAQSICAKAKDDIAALAACGTVPRLGVVRIGENAADLSYERGLTKRFASVGAEVEVHVLDSSCTRAEAAAVIRALDKDTSVHGILLFRPLPRHLNEGELISLISPIKDVDGASIINGGLLFGGKECHVPCTAGAVMALMKEYSIDPSGKDVCIVGRSSVVGKPLAMLLIKENATVTVCHTKTRDLAAHLRRSDIVVACAGKMNTVTADMVKRGAVLIDVGMNASESGLCGDISSDCYALASAYTPVPGGVGAVTTAVLLSNTVRAAAEQTDKPTIGVIGIKR